MRFFCKRIKVLHKEDISIPGENNCTQLHESISERLYLNQFFKYRHLYYSHFSGMFSAHF